MLLQNFIHVRMCTSFYYMYVVYKLLYVRSVQAFNYYMYVVYKILLNVRSVQAFTTCT